MGVFILHEWATLLAMVSGTYAVWAGIWGIMYRKFFWDIVGGTLGPAGIIPGPNSAIFVKLIVTIPLIQILNIVNGVLTLGLEWPLPFVKGTAVHRSFALRGFFYVWCGFIAMLPYQTIDAGLFYAITAAVYATAISKGERMETNVGKVTMA
ncbi:hypothetical protein MNV49_004530 [Pseudohyphozyma bogoriensis]|nr:hypothetical protein MNV49_004530 [Pseudohyphozyma bogoriensis]